MGIILEALGNYCKKSPWFSLLLGITLYIFCLFVCVPLLMGLINTMYGLEWAETAAIVGGNLQIERDIQAFRLLQGGAQLLTWGLAAILMAGFFDGSDQFLRLNLKTPFIFSLLGILIILSSFPLVERIYISQDMFRLPASMADLERIMHDMEASQSRLLEKILYQASLEDFVANLFVFAVCPAIAEELFFRGFMQKNFYRMMNPHLAVWVTGLIFSLIHLQFYGFFSRWLLGVLLGYLVYASGSLIPAMIGHFIFNAISIAAFHQYASVGDTTILENESLMHFPPAWLIAGSGIMLVLSAIYWGLARNNQTFDQ